MGIGTSSDNAIGSMIGIIMAIVPALVPVEKESRQVRRKAIGVKIVGFRRRIRTPDK